MLHGGAWRSFIAPLPAPGLQSSLCTYRPRGPGSPHSWVSVPERPVVEVAESPSKMLLLLCAMILGSVARSRCVCDDIKVLVS